jgi:hypothetical protein
MWMNSLPSIFYLFFSPSIVNEPLPQVQQTSGIGVNVYFGFCRCFARGIYRGRNHYSASSRSHTPPKSTQFSIKDGEIYSLQGSSSDFVALLCNLKPALRTSKRSSRKHNSVPIYAIIREDPFTYPEETPFHLPGEKPHKMSNTKS